MKQLRILPLALTLLSCMVALSLTSCSEENDEVEEFPDWQETNDEYFSSLYTEATRMISLGDPTWKVFLNWSLPLENSAFTANIDDYIVVEVIEEGTGSGCPLYTDNAWVHYRGRLLPSVSYPTGYIFDQSYYGDFNEQTASPVSFTVSALVDGFTTALLNMHIGDYWRVYIPANLGYGSYGSGAIPGYSLLIFEVKLVAYAHADVDLPITW